MVNLWYEDYALVDGGYEKESAKLTDMLGVGRFDFERDIDPQKLTVRQHSVPLKDSIENWEDFDAKYYAMDEEIRSMAMTTK